MAVEVTRMINATSVITDIPWTATWSSWIVSAAAFAAAFATVLQLSVLVMVATPVAERRRSPYVYVWNLLVVGAARSTAAFVHLLLRAEHHPAFYPTPTSDQTTTLDGALFRWNGSGVETWWPFVAVLSAFNVSLLQAVLALDRHVRVAHFRLGIRKCSGLIYAPVVLCVWGVAFAVALLETHRPDAMTDCRSGSAALDYTVLGRLSAPALVVFAVTLLLADLLHLRTYSRMRGLRKMRPARDPSVHSGWILHGDRTDIFFGAGSFSPPPGAARWPQQRSALLCIRLNVVCQLSWLPGLGLALYELVASYCWTRTVVCGKSGDAAPWWWALTLIENAYVIAVPVVCIKHLLGEKLRTVGAKSAASTGSHSSNT